MKKYTKYIAVIIAFVAVLAAAVFGYKYLSGRYSPEENTGAAQQNSADTAADFTVFTAAGEEVSFSDYKGKPLVVNLWATWCGPCKSELPAFNELYAEYKNSVEFMMVNLTDGYSDTVQSVRKFVEEKQYSFPVFYDTKLSAAKAYTVNSVPLTIFIDKNGVIVNEHLGAMEKDTLQKYIESLL